MATISEAQFPIGRLDSATAPNDPIEAEDAQSVATTEVTVVAPNADADVPASSRWDRATKRTVIVILLVGTGFVLWLSQPVLPIVITAALVAYLLSPIVDTGERVYIPRVSAP